MGKNEEGKRVDKKVGKNVEGKRVDKEQVKQVGKMRRGIAW